MIDSNYAYYQSVKWNKKGMSLPSRSREAWGETHSIVSKLIPRVQVLSRLNKVVRIPNNAFIPTRKKSVSQAFSWTRNNSNAMLICLQTFVCDCKGTLFFLYMQDICRKILFLFFYKPVKICILALKQLLVPVPLVRIPLGYHFHFQATFLLLVHLWGV